MHYKKHLSFSSLRKCLSGFFHRVVDHRDSRKIQHRLHDGLMSAFACMFFQSASILQFQKRLESQFHTNNLKTMFGVESIPESTQLREMLDEVDGTQFGGIFKEITGRLQRGKHLEQYQLFPGHYYCPLDGTQYFASKSVSCKHCLRTKKSRKEKSPKTTCDGTCTEAIEREDKESDTTGMSYSHKVVQGALMHPDMRQVIPFMPEEIRNTDGVEKQDCEVNAAKRLLPKLRQTHPRLGLIIGGDDLYSRSPMIDAVKTENMHYLFVAKPESHPYMTEWLAAYPALHSHQTTEIKGKRKEKEITHHYQWMNKIPLHGEARAPQVNFFRYEMRTVDSKGKETVVYRNNWVTDIEVTAENVATLVRAGRCRWKIENECFNTLKNQGYAMEHNYGHGKKNLCFNFYLLILLAFTFHQVFELTDKVYQACRKRFGSKQALWENARVTLRFFIFDCWESFLDFLLRADNLPDSASAPPVINTS